MNMIGIDQSLMAHIPAAHHHSNTIYIDTYNALPDALAGTDAQQTVASDIFIRM